LALSLSPLPGRCAWEAALSSVVLRMLTLLMPVASFFPIPPTLLKVLLLPVFQACALSFFQRWMSFFIGLGISRGLGVSLFLVFSLSLLGVVWANLTFHRFFSPPLCPLTFPLPVAWSDFPLGQFSLFFQFVATPFFRSFPLLYVH